MNFVSVATIFWLVVGASVLHVLEEYFGGFVTMMRRYGPLRGMTENLFIVVNAVFISLCVVAALVNIALPIYSLSIAALILINAIIHVGAAVRLRGYAAGLITAIVLYVPLSVYAYLLYVQAGIIDLNVFVSSLALGIGWMILAVGSAMVMGHRQRHSKK